MKNPYEAAPYGGEDENEWGVFHKPTSNWSIFGTEEAMKRRAKEMNENDEISAQLGSEALEAFERLLPTQQEIVRIFLRENHHCYLHGKRDVVDAYLKWEGIIGYTENLIQLVRRAYGDEK